MKIDKVNISSVARISGFIGFFIGLIFGTFYSFVFGSIYGLLLGVGIFVGAPFLYGLMLYVCGALFGCLYNFAAKRIGGISFVLSEDKKK